MLKVLSVIFSIYFLALSMVPCADGVDCAEVQVHQEMLVEHDHSDHQHPASEDLCTPFCACQCCHTSITVSAFFTLNESPGLHLQLTSFYSEHPYSTYPASLLDPPRV